MYFPGSTLEQIAALQQRVSNLEGQNAFQNKQPQVQEVTSDQNEYQYQNGVQTASMGSPYTSASLQEYGKGVSGVGTCSQSSGYTPGFYTVKFVDSKNDAEIVADGFRSETGFLVFYRHPTLTNGFSRDTAVAAFPAYTVSSITKP